MLTRYSVKCRALIDSLVAMVGGGGKRERSGTRHSAVTSLDYEGGERRWTPLSIEICLNS